jgi:signal transduction histidine kinase
VSDSGPGFPPDFLPHAFERFRRVDTARAEGGTGLGLAIVDAIAQAHSGRAAARNAPEGGADVWIELDRVG